MARRKAERNISCDAGQTVLPEERTVEQWQTLLKLSEDARLEVLIKLAGLPGHSSPSTTSRVYTDLLDQDHKEMLEKMWTQRCTPATLSTGRLCNK